MVDEGKIVQVIENILSNGIKYSPEGGPIMVRGEITCNGYILAICDRGIGMTSEQVAKVFDKFYRADCSNTAIGGTGLGMSIVKHFIEAHGGTVEVESAPGTGTTVCLTLPLEG
jgi:signal transduction histidine kinase